jgi:undecaprenyl-diphosphatase
MIDLITNIDFSVLNAIQGIRNGFLDQVIPYITFLGSGGAIWIAVTVVMLIIKRTRKIGIALAVALIVGYVISTVGVKLFIARERPFNTYGAILDEDSLLIGAPWGRYSFPSGHALSSFSAATVLFCYNRKFGTAAIVLAVLIAFSRLYLYVHFPTDVIGGAILGIVIALISVAVVNRAARRRSKIKG